MLRDVTPRAMAITAPRDAPADTPIIPGSANGLENTPCITAPASAKAPPTRRPMIRRGMRINHNTASCSAVIGSVKLTGIPMPFKILCTPPPIGIIMVPTWSANKLTIHSNTPIRVMAMMRCFCLVMRIPF